MLPVTEEGLLDVRIRNQESEMVALRGERGGRNVPSDGTTAQHEVCLLSDYINPALWEGLLARRTQAAIAHEPHSQQTVAEALIQQQS